MPSDIGFEIFKLSAAGYCCTQIMLKMALNEEGIENEDLIRSTNGLCKGIAGKQGTCGILIGGIMIIGLYAGKGGDKEHCKDNYGDMANEFIDWFKDKFESIECVDLIGVTKFNNGDASYILKCGDLIIESYGKVAQILTENGYEFGERQ